LRAGSKGHDPGARCRRRVRGRRHARRVGNGADLKWHARGLPIAGQNSVNLRGRALSRRRSRASGGRARRKCDIQAAWAWAWGMGVGMGIWTGMGHGAWGLGHRWHGCGELGL